MNEKELQTLIEHISLEYFGKPFEHESHFNGRLRSTGGRFMFYTRNIEINPKVIALADDYKFLIQAIKHELCHYHLYIENKGYRHQDEDFKALLKAVDAPQMLHINLSQKTYEYKCQHCEQVLISHRKIDDWLLKCGYCGGDVKHLPYHKPNIKQPHPKVLNISFEQLLQTV